MFGVSVHPKGSPGLAHNSTQVTCDARVIRYVVRLHVFLYNLLPGPGLPAHSTVVAFINASPHHPLNPSVKCGKKICRN